MTLSKQALQEALADESRGRWSWQLPTFVVAARFVERLLPGECLPECDNGVWRVRGSIHDGKPHNLCHGTGQLWDEGLVEIVAEAFYSSVAPAFGSKPWDSLLEETKEVWRTHARTVLAALAEKVGP